MKIKFALVMMFLISNDLFATLPPLPPLSCSANGLNILYINGVNVPNVKDAQTSASKISDSIQLISGELDKKKVFPTSLVHNQSRKLLNDVEELKAQLAANHQGKKRLEYWNAQAQDQLVSNQDFLWKEKIEEALKQIIKAKSHDKYGNFIVDQNAYTKSDLYKDLAEYNAGLANLVANAASDVAVVEQLKINILQAYNSGKNKLIVVAHSQGNEVLYSAIKDIRNSFATPDEVKKFDAFVGYIQVAPPSPRLVVDTGTIVDDVIVNGPNDIPNFYTDHAQYIRHDKDLVIGFSEQMTGVRPINANYNATSMTTQQLLVYSSVYALPFSLGISALFEYFTRRGGEAFYHGMNDIYLSSTFTARRSSTGSNKALLEHFKDNMREIATTLRGNCDVEIVSDKIDCRYGFDQNGYYITGGMHSFTMKAKGHGIIRQVDGESENQSNLQVINVDTDDFIPGFPVYLANITGSMHLKFKDEYDKVLYDKVVANPCVEGTRSSAGDNYPKFSF